MTVKLLLPSIEFLIYSALTNASIIVEKSPVGSSSSDGPTIGFSVFRDNFFLPQPSRTKQHTVFPFVKYNIDYECYKLNVILSAVRLSRSMVHLTARKTAQLTYLQPITKHKNQPRKFTDGKKNLTKG